MAHYISSTGFRVFHAFEEFSLGLHDRREFRRLPNTNFGESATVIISAYNEGKVIAGTLRPLLKTD